MGGRVHQRRASEISNGNDDGGGGEVALPARFFRMTGFRFLFGGAPTNEWTNKSSGDSDAGGGQKTK